MGFVTTRSGSDRSQAKPFGGRRDARHRRAGQIVLDCDEVLPEEHG